MNIFRTETPNRQATVNGLAAVGFIALIAAGMWLAVYSTRFVPTVVNGAGEAAVYLGSFFAGTPAPTLSVVPNPIASTTLPAAIATSTEINTTASPPAKTVDGSKTNTVIQIPTPSTPSLFGFPDLVVTITATGYLVGTTTDSFVASSAIPNSIRAAVQFTIKNIGTNVTGPWRFSASIPTQVVYIYQSPLQQPLGPGDSIDYTLGFDQANRGVDQTISITANFDHAVVESNTDNNSASTKMTILGS